MGSYEAVVVGHTRRTPQGVRLMSFTYTGDRAMTLNHHLKMRQQMRELLDYYQAAIMQATSVEQQRIAKLLLDSMRADLKAIEATISEA